jgi:hypothetical protein
MSKERKFQLTNKNKFKMKKLKFTTKPAIALYAMLAVVLLCGCQHSQNYCGKVSEKYLLHKNNGGTHNVVFYCDSLHKFVNVSVTEDCYVNTKEGETVCFTLSDYQVGK